MSTPNEHLATDLSSVPSLTYSNTGNMLYAIEAQLPPFSTDEVAPENLTYFQYGLVTATRLAGSLPGDARRGSIDIFNVASRPDLLVRSYDDDEITLEGMTIIDQSIRAARESGIPVIPFDYYEAASGFSRVVVPKLNGISLELALSQQVPELVTDVDNLWAAHARHYSEQDAKFQPMAEDIVAPHQYLVASLPGETESQIWMPDIGAYVLQRNTRLYQEFYLQILGSTAEAIVSLEATLGGEQLVKARVSLRNALDSAETNNNAYYRGIKRVAEFILTHSEILDYHDMDEIPQEFVF